MIKIYYHIYAVRDVINIVKNQLDYELNIIILSGTEQDKISFQYKTDDIKIWLEENNYKIRKIIYETDCRNEWQTLNCILEDKEKYEDNDYILYLHTKGVTHTAESSPEIGKDRGVTFRAIYEKFTPNWKKIMEYYLIEKYYECVYILKNTKFNTVGTFLNEPMWNCLTYAGNMFWMKGDYAKTLGNFQNTLFNNENFDKKINSTAEFNFVNSGLNWNPYSVFNIPYDIFTDNDFVNLLKTKKNEL